MSCHPWHCRTQLWLHPNRHCRAIGSVWGSFAASPRGRPTGYDGRVEPLVSGQVARFHAREAWLAFMTRALADMLCTPTQGGQRPRAVDPRSEPQLHSALRERRQDMKMRAVVSRIRVFILVA